MKLKYRPSDWGQRLDHCMCRVEGQAAYVIVQDGNIMYKTSYDGEYKNISSSKMDNLDISSVPLGYLNVNRADAVMYITRIPSRNYKQGVCSRNIRSYGIDGNTESGYLPDASSPAFFDMVNNKYPTLDSVMKKKGEFQRAISRDVAIKQNSLGVKNVYFKTDLIGWIPPDKNKIILQSGSKGFIVEQYLKGFQWDIERAS